MMTSVDNYDFLVKEDFIRNVLSRHLVDTYRARTDLYEQGHADGFWNGRLLGTAGLDPKAQYIMRWALEFAIVEIEAFYRVYRPLYPDTLQIVGWPAPHPGMPIHSDNAYEDGSPHVLAHRAYSGVIYLTDDYEGGELLLPAQGLRLRPPRGTLVSLPGGLTHQHGVAPVERGDRITLAFFLTHDRDKGLVY